MFLIRVIYLNLNIEYVHVNTDYVPVRKYGLRTYFEKNVNACVCIIRTLKKVLNVSQL